MTDYKNLKLIASSSPHIRSSESTRTIMMDVIIAMIPALAMSVFVFGFRALALTLVSVAACVFWEWAYRKLMKKSNMVGDLSAVVTGILLSFVCPGRPRAARATAIFPPSGIPLSRLYLWAWEPFSALRALRGRIRRWWWTA